MARPLYVERRARVAEFSRAGDRGHIRPRPRVPSAESREPIPDYRVLMLPPGLSMLWEDVDPLAALRERFGFADAEDAADWVRRMLATHWEVDVADCVRVVLSDRNVIAWLQSSAGPLVVKWSCDVPRFPALEASTELLSELDRKGVPVAAPLPSQDARVRRELAGPLGPLSLAVLPEVDGHWLDVDDLAAVRDAGAALARVHAALRSCTGRLPAPTAGATAQEEPADRIRRWLAQSDHGAVPEASQRLAHLLEQAPALTAEPQLVHHDFRSANILVRDSAVVAVLDLDEAEPAHRVDDLARASVYLATRFRDWGPTPAPAREALRAGYEAALASDGAAPLSEAESAWAEILTLWYGLAAVRSGPRREEWAATL